MENQNRELTQDEVIDQKLHDAETPGYEVAFDPDEAERIAFREDAMWTRTRGTASWIYNARNKQGG
jgi:hypothetical protein